MDKRFIVILVSIIVIFGGIFFYTRSKNTSNGGSNSSVQGTVSNHVQGTGTTGVTLVEYGDFQCPACGQYYPLLKQVQQKYGDKIVFQFRNFPLVQIHQNAMAASRAAEAAGKQGKYWEMHDALYEQQSSWTSSSSPTAIFEAYAAQLGLNAAQFKTDMESDAVLGTINADIKAGQAYKITGTPTFILDGKKIEESPRDLAGFEKLINDAIASKKQ
jgi:protein-disulfide isomerase